MLLPDLRGRYRIYAPGGCVFFFFMGSLFLLVYATICYDSKVFDLCGPAKGEEGGWVASRPRGLRPGVWCREGPRAWRVGGTGPCHTLPFTDQRTLHIN
jgi:hypothetical protein